MGCFYVKNKIDKNTLPEYFYFNNGALLITDNYLQYEYGDTFHIDTGKIVDFEDVYFNESTKAYDKSECMRFKISKKEIEKITIENGICTIIGNGILYNPYNYDCEFNMPDSKGEKKCNVFSFLLHLLMQIVKKK